MRGRKRHLFSLDVLKALCSGLKGISKKYRSALTERECKGTIPPFMTPFHIFVEKLKFLIEGRNIDIFICLPGVIDKMTTLVIWTNAVSNPIGRSQRYVDEYKVKLSL